MNPGAMTIINPWKELSYGAWHILLKRYDTKFKVDNADSQEMADSETKVMVPSP